MKKLLLFVLAISLLAVSCNKNKGILDPNSKVFITGVQSTKAHNPAGTGIMGTGITDSVKFVAAYTLCFRCKSTDGKDTEWQSMNMGSGINPVDYDDYHDTINNKLIYHGYHVIHEGGLGWFIIDCKDAVLIVIKDSNGNAILPKDTDEYVMNGGNAGAYDTVGYIPNAKLRVTQQKIIDAYNREDYEACYRMFNDEFIFVPTTGEKWRAMKAAGIE